MTKQDIFVIVGKTSRSARCIPVRLLVTTFNNSHNLLELSFHAYKMNPDPNPNPNPNNPKNLLDTTILLEYNVRIEWKNYIKGKWKIYPLIYPD